MTTLVSCALTLSAMYGLAAVSRTIIDRYDRRKPGYVCEDRRHCDRPHTQREWMSSPL